MLKAFPLWILLLCSVELLCIASASGQSEFFITATRSLQKLGELHDDTIVSYTISTDKGRPFKTSGWYECDQLPTAVLNSRRWIDSGAFRCWLATFPSGLSSEQGFVLDQRHRHIANKSECMQSEISRVPFHLAVITSARKDSKSDSQVILCLDYVWSYFCWFSLSGLGQLPSFDIKAVLRTDLEKMTVKKVDHEIPPCPVTHLLLDDESYTLVAVSIQSGHMGCYVCALPDEASYCMLAEQIKKTVNDFVINGVTVIRKSFMANVGISPVLDLSQTEVERCYLAFTPDWSGELEEGQYMYKRAGDRLGGTDSEDWERARRVFDIEFPVDGGSACSMSEVKVTCSKEVMDAARKTGRMWGKVAEHYHFEKQERLKSPQEYNFLSGATSGSAGLYQSTDGCHTYSAQANTVLEVCTNVLARLSVCEQQSRIGGKLSNDFYRLEQRLDQHTSLLTILFSTETSEELFLKVIGDYSAPVEVIHPARPADSVLVSLLQSGSGLTGGEPDLDMLTVDSGTSLNGSPFTSSSDPVVNGLDDGDNTTSLVFTTRKDVVVATPATSSSTSPINIPDSSSQNLMPAHSPALVTVSSLTLSQSEGGSSSPESAASVKRSSLLSTSPSSVISGSSSLKSHSSTAQAKTRHANMDFNDIVEEAVIQTLKLKAFTCIPSSCKPPPIEGQKTKKLNQKQIRAKLEALYNAKDYREFHLMCRHYCGCFINTDKSIVCEK